MSFANCMIFAARYVWHIVNALILVYCLSQFTWILNNFSNSLITRKEKTKETITEKEVWICDPSYHKIRWTLVLEAMSNTRKHISSSIQTLQSWLKNSSAPLFFSTHFSVFGYLMKHSSLCLIYYRTNLVKQTSYRTGHVQWLFVVFLLAARFFLKKQIRGKHKLFKVELNVDKSFRDGGQIQNV